VKTEDATNLEQLRQFGESVTVPALIITNQFSRHPNSPPGPFTLHIILNLFQMAA